MNELPFVEALFDTLEIKLIRFRRTVITPVQECGMKSNPENGIENLS